MGPEAKIEKAICDYAKSKGFYVRKFKSPGQRAVPDRIFISPSGGVFFIEFKASGKTPTKLQYREINIIRNHNVKAYWTDDIKDGIKLVEAYL